MGSMFRSEEMVLCEMYVPPEASFEILSALGELGIAEFVDMCPEQSAFRRHYVAEVCRYNAIEQKLFYMRAEMNKEKMEVVYNNTNPSPLHPNNISSFEAVVEKWSSEVVESAQYQANLLKDYMRIKEMHYVLQTMGPELGSSEIGRDTLFNTNTPASKMTTTAGGDTKTPRGQLIVMTGVVQRVKSYKFELMLWRISRGIMYYKQATLDQEIQDPVTKVIFRVVAFLIVFQGNEIMERFEKVCSGFKANLYPCPRTLKERMELVKKTFMRLNDMEEVIRKTSYHRCKLLRLVSRQWHGWMIRVKKSKAVYHTMNLFSRDITRKCLIGQCWVPKSDIVKIQDLLNQCSANVGTYTVAFVTTIETLEEPPTFHRTNKFTYGFQSLINAYGDSTYREINPGLYTVVTFPILFGLMFGDMGHACIMITFASWMLIKEQKFLNARSDSEIWKIFFGGRYIILMMGIYSFIAGLIYNDFFSKCIVFRRSYWLNHYSDKVLLNNKLLLLDPNMQHYKPYPYGIDPGWIFAKNRIMFENSIKMKLSIIIGITHMCFGIILGLFNHLYFKHYYAIFLEFIPQITFMFCIFVWLVFLIFAKWLMYYAAAINPAQSIACAPLILILFIDMVLLKTSQPVGKECNAYLFDFQLILQRVLLLTAVLMIPIMLFGAPFYLRHHNRKKVEEIQQKIEDLEHTKRQVFYSTGNEKNIACLKHQLEHYNKSFIELLVYQDIHTIEFILSTVSHTASYLRLWALSLAHAQLSHMLWLMVLNKNGLKKHNWYGFVMIFLMFAMWAGLTVSVLVVMEGLSAFLHTLRLHWVEFMSKFFTGQGHQFSPFDFAEIAFSDQKRTEGICKGNPLNPENEEKVITMN